MATVKYFLLLALLGITVYVVPFLWEVALVGAIVGAVWTFAWPKEADVFGESSV